MKISKELIERIGVLDKFMHNIESNPNKCYNEDWCYTALVQCFAFSREALI